MPETRRLPRIISLYFGRQFLLGFVIVLLVMLGIVFLFDTVELLRRAAKRPDVPFGMVMQMALLKLPQVGQQMFAFAALFGGIFSCWRLTRSHELVVARAAGLSVWQFLAPALIAAFALGMLKPMVINPAAAVMLSAYERLDDRLLKGKTNLVNLAESGLWLREMDDTGNQVILHARAMPPGKKSLKDVTVFFFGPNDTFEKRIDAPEAVMAPGAFEISGGWLNVPGKKVEPNAHISLPTDLTPQKIEDSFAEPDTLSFWRMPAFIAMMERTGFPATRLRMHFLALLAEPILLVGMVLLAAAVALRPPRRGGALVLMALGAGTGFVLFFLTDLVQALGLAGTIPVGIAAFIPPLICVLLGASALLYLEDG